MYERYLQTGVENNRHDYRQQRYAGVIKRFFLSTKWHMEFLSNQSFFWISFRKPTLLWRSFHVILNALLVSVLIARSVSRPIMYLAAHGKK
jgi:hypothetical protein